VHLIAGLAVSHTLTMVLHIRILDIKTQKLRMKMALIRDYYWRVPVLNHSASLLHMLELMGTPYEYISDRAEMTKVCSAFGNLCSKTFVPPVLVNGNCMISQSVASCLYLG
jgi:hypothetical protein